MLVGTLILEGIDMFWTDCRFEPGPGWGEISPLFEAFKAAVPQGPDAWARVDQDIAAQGMVLVPDDGGEPITRRQLRIHQGSARFRG